jgi:hypothetical protein
VGTPVTRTITLDNANNVNSNQPITIASLAVNNGTVTSGVTGTYYTRPAGAPGGTCPAVGGQIAAGATCTIIVQLSQTLATVPTGTTTGTVAVSITGTSGTVALPPVTLTANSIAATFHASITPGALTFGPTTVGTPSATQNLTVANTGNSALGGVTLTGITAPFSRVNTGPFPAGAGNCPTTSTWSLAVGASCTIKVRFTPTATGAAPTRTVTIGGAAATSPNPAATATLNGTGAAATVSFNSASVGVLSSGTLNFGNVNVVSSVLTLKVVGASPVTFGNASLAGSNRYTIGADGCATHTVNSGGTCTITINFNGTGTTARNGTLTVVDSTGAEPVLPLNLTGN